MPSSFTDAKKLLNFSGGNGTRHSIAAWGGRLCTLDRSSERFVISPDARLVEQIASEIGCESNSNFLTRLNFQDLYLAAPLIEIRRRVRLAGLSDTSTQIYPVRHWQPLSFPCG
jgi:hypothetical protein